MTFLLNIDWATALAVNLVIAFAMIGFQYMLCKIFKRKTKPESIAFYQLGIPAMIIGPVELFLFSPLGLFFQIVLLLSIFGALNYTEAWFREHFKHRGQAHITINIREADSDSGDTNIYESKYQPSTIFHEVLANNLDVLLAISSDDFLFPLIAHYLEIHPEDKEILMEYKKLVKEAEKIESKTDIDKIQEEIGKQKLLCIKIFQKSFEGAYLHIIYFPWNFYLERREPLDLQDKVQAVILSTKPKLPDTFSLNCTIMQDENIHGKWFTTIFALEGERDDALLRKISNYAINLGIMTELPTLSDVEGLELEVEALRAQNKTIVKKYKKLGKEFITLNEQIQNAYPTKEDK